MWRFPFLVFQYGGLPFLIPFFIMLFLAGIPIFFLETAIGQFSGLSPSHAFAKMVPVFQVKISFLIKIYSILYIKIYS